MPEGTETGGIMKRFAGLVVLLGLLAPGVAHAQRHYSGNPFSFAPYVGVYKDPYDAEADGSDLGWMLGFRAGYRESQRLNLNVNFGYAQASDVATHVALAPVVDNQWVLLTGGLDFALVPGATSIALGVDAGVAWRRTKAEDESGTGWGTYELVAPALTLRHSISSRSSLFVTAQDYLFDVLEGPVEHSPALTMGLSFR
jgi:hypothetical protein